MRPAYLSAQYKTCDGGCTCGGRGGAPVVAVDCGCGCNGAPGGCGGGATAGRSAGDITPPGRPCPGGWARLPDGSCPGDTPSGGGPGVDPTALPGQGGCPSGQRRDPVTNRCVPFSEQVNELPPGWQSWNAEQRAAYARDAVARAGGTTAEQQAAAERARQADNAMIVGIVTQGVGAIRQWLQTSSAERLAEIDAQARVQIAEIQARNGSQAALLELERLRLELERLRGGGGYSGGASAPSSGPGVVETGLGLGILAKLLGWF